MGMSTNGQNMLFQIEGMLWVCGKSNNTFNPKELFDSCKMG